MEIEGRITSAMPAQSGVSVKTGQPWMSQEFVISYYWWPNQTVPSQMCFRVFGEDRLREFCLNVNDEVKLRFYIDAHPGKDGRMYNDVRCTAVQHLNQRQAEQSAQPASAPITQPAGSPAPSNVMTKSAVLPADPLEAPIDDLPF